MGIENSDSFVHLHVHSQYSLLEASCRLKNLCEKAKGFHMPALALTDYGNMFGVPEFYFEAKEKGFKPILGLEIFLTPSFLKEKGTQNKKHKKNEASSLETNEVFIEGEKNNKDNSSSPLTKRESEIKEEMRPKDMTLRSLVLLAQNEEGYQNLCRINSMGYKNTLHGRPCVDESILKKFHSSLILLSGGINGEIAWSFLHEGKEVALEKIRFLHSVYKDRFYLELNRTGLSSSEKLNHFLLEVAKSMRLPYVAANDVRYLEQKDHIIYEVLLCIGRNETFQNESRKRLETDQFYFKSSKEMRELFHDCPEACDRSLEIAERTQFDFRLYDENQKPIYHLPTYPTREDVTLQEELNSLSLQGLKERFVEASERGEEIKEKEKYFTRLDYEKKVIHDMGLSGYFLIVQDFVGWARKNHIPVGPGRGSGAGSLVAYALGITDLDPLKYGLVFERFLNPERISMPDFDIDFCQEKRAQVIDYVTKKYGEESVSQIITFGTLQARAAVRDVGRVIGMRYLEVDKVAKLVPTRLGIQINQALKEESRLSEWMEKDSKVAILIDLAQKVEGLVRHASIHAAGVVISEGDIVRHAPIWRGVEGGNVIQYDRKYAEKIGLIKFDFLGLKTLTHIHECLRLIEKNQGIRLTTKDISLSDPGIYEIMRRGDTEGIFQFEGSGITNLLQKAAPTCFEDIVAINALYRPGPMEMIPEYLKRKMGKVKYKFIFPELKEILKETYGIVIYQEQVQLIASRIASYSLGEADILRRAMGKKIPQVMAQQKDRFLSGARKNGYNVKKAEKLFETMQEFAKYGFNKSHAAAYCVIAAQTAYLKNYYPAEFFTSLLSTVMGDTERVVRYVRNAKASSLQVLPPHINHSDYRFTLEGKKIFFSLGGIKGVGQSAVSSIVQSRHSQETKEFSSLSSFFESVDVGKVKKNTLECLIKAGAFDHFGWHRAKLLKACPYFIKRAEQRQREKKVGQQSLFSFHSAFQKEDDLRLDFVPDWSRSQKLDKEKEVLGFYLSDHPLKGLNDRIKRNIKGRKWKSQNFLNVREAMVSVPLKNKDFLMEEESGKNKSVSRNGERLPKNGTQSERVMFLGLISRRKEILTRKGTKMAFLQLEDLTGSIEVIFFPKTYEEFKEKTFSKDPVLVVGELSRKDSQVKCVAHSLENAKNHLL